MPETSFISSSQKRVLPDHTLLSGESMRNIIFLSFILVIITSCGHASELGVIIYDICDYGAIGDGKTLNTAYIQDAIDSCAEKGGGTIRIAGGRYVTGTLYMKSNVTISISANAELLGSTDINDYTTDTYRMMYEEAPQMNRCMIYAENASNIGIEGKGIIDGQGQMENFPNEDDPAKSRPLLIRFKDCTNIFFRDITLNNPATWTTVFLYCSEIKIDGITINSLVNHNGDGLDFDGCRNVIVSNCTFNNSDDSICLQTSRRDMPCENVVVTNCIMSSDWAAFRIGLLSVGDIRNVTISNCIIKDTKCGFKIQMCEGAIIEDITVSNIVMERVVRPLFLTLNSFRFCIIEKEKDRELPPILAMRNIHFSNIRASINNIQFPESNHTKNMIMAIVGLPGHYIEDITLDNISVTKEQNTQRSFNEGDDVPEFEGLRPEAFQWNGELPASMLYLRHVKRIAISNTTFDFAHADTRPAIFCDDVEHLELSHIASYSNEKQARIFSLYDTKEALISACRIPSGTTTFLEVGGTRCGSIILSGNDLRKAETAVKIHPDSNISEVIMEGNIR
jgi:polygalacturonase